MSMRNATRSGAVRWTEEDRGYATPCWVWQRAKVGPYGVVKVARQQVYAHRHAYEASRGAIPKGLTIDHLCRVQACVNPDHLEVVTYAENTRRSSLATLRAADAVLVLQLALTTTLSHGAIAEIVGMSRPLVSLIVSGRRWRLNLTQEA
jgi:hypothetical protein